MAAGKDSFFLNTICVCCRGDASLMTESSSGVEAQQRLVATRPALANMLRAPIQDDVGDRTQSPWRRLVSECLFAAVVRIRHMISPSVSAFLLRGLRASFARSRPDEHVQSSVSCSQAGAAGETPSFCLAALPAEPQVCYLSP